MNMQEFYERYNLNKYNFAEIAGVGHRSLVKFAKGEPIREDTKSRIEKAICVAEIYDLRRPKFDYSKGIYFGHSYKSEFHRSVYEYNKRFKALLEKE